MPHNPGKPASAKQTWQSALCLQEVPLREDTTMSGQHPEEGLFNLWGPTPPDDHVRNYEIES